MKDAEPRIRKMGALTIRGTGSRAPSFRREIFLACLPHDGNGRIDRDLFCRERIGESGLAINTRRSGERSAWKCRRMVKGWVAMVVAVQTQLGLGHVLSTRRTSPECRADLMGAPRIVSMEIGRRGRDGRVPQIVPDRDEFDAIRQCVRRMGMPQPVGAGRPESRGQFNVIIGDLCCGEGKERRRQLAQPRRGDGLVAMTGGFE